MTAKPTLVVRSPNFDFTHVPKHWNGGRKAITTFFDSLSLFFPPGERFFIASVRAHDEFVKDDELREEVRGFYGQEGMHTREHIKYNAWLEKQGYPAAKLEREIAALLANVKRTVPKREQLATTAALEHLTAILAHLALDNDEALQGADPTMAALWRWHAAEEAEHKAVSFDVYKAVGGNYFERSSTLLIATAIFWVKMFQHQRAMMRADGTARSLTEWRALLRFLFVKPGVITRLMPYWVKWFRPGFHPNDIDDSHLHDAWIASQKSSPYSQAMGGNAASSSTSASA
ncbi:MAG: metal-dependent hydrolase [Polyangiaceae bacterium]|nr:metal-dependent hydrolase [Polyangiaceae bacterium]